MSGEVLEVVVFSALSPKEYGCWGCDCQDKGKGNQNSVELPGSAAQPFHFPLSPQISFLLTLPPLLLEILQMFYSRRISLYDCLSLSHSPSSSPCPNVWPTLTCRFLVWNCKYSGKKCHPFHSKQLGHHSLSFSSHYKYLWNLALCKTLFLGFGRQSWMKECP